MAGGSRAPRSRLNFGTDGVRGVANQDLTPELALLLGRAAGHVLGGPGHRVVIGRDTRRSGRMLESALAAGLCSVGVEVRLVGHVTTPGLAYLARTGDAVAGAVISASHNPALDNGIKFFDQQGLKLADGLEEQIEAAMTASDLPRPTEGGIGLVGDARGLVKEYEDFLVALAPRLDRRRVILDCANGSAYRSAPSVFARAGADVVAIFDSPDGLNINAGCGSTSPEALQRTVAGSSDAIGFAFDGDGDRVVAVDHTGALHDGDTLLAIAARHAVRNGGLTPPVVVGTVMSNGGLEATLARDGIVLERVAVGDRNVWERLVQLDAALGGEPSGHLIFRRRSPSGDGILSALELMRVMSATGRSLADLAADIERWPQVHRNVRVPRRHEWREVPSFARAYDEIMRDLGTSGRLIVRPSGTEPVLRITVEARDPLVAAASAGRLEAAAREHLA